MDVSSLLLECSCIMCCCFSLHSLLYEPLQKGVEVKKSEILVLDPKRSNALNIGMKVLPAVHIIKAAILAFDEFAISKEGIEVRTGGISLGLNCFTLRALPCYLYAFLHYCLDSSQVIRQFVDSVDSFTKYKLTTQVPQI